MEDNRKQFTLRIEKVAFDKLEIIAKRNKRSVNGQLEFMLDELILEYERKYGSIRLGEGNS